MASMIRAYKDGQRMVLIIENPTRDLESLVASLISGEISAVKDLEAPKEMEKPSFDTKEMEEIKTPYNKEETPAPVEISTTPKLPRFVANLKEKEEQRNTKVKAAEVNTQVEEPEKPVTSSKEPDAKQSVSVEDVVNTEETVSTKPVEVKAKTVTEVETIVTSAVPKDAKLVVEPEPEEVVTNVVSVSNVSDTTKASDQAEPVKTVNVNTDTVNVSNQTVQQEQANNRMRLIKFVKLHKDSGFVKAQLRQRFKNPNYPIERLTTNQLQWFADKLRKM